MSNTWHGCYESSWKGMITPASFAHPAKFSRDLIERIYDHCLERGWLKPGSVVGDCFGGIGTGGITAAYRGIRWVGCELEPRFCKMAESNFAIHAHKWLILGAPTPHIIQGDSRRFAELVACSGVVTSPPFAQSDCKKGGSDLYRDWAKQHGRDPESATAQMHGSKDAYGEEAGQIGRLKSGEVDAVLTSPPWEDKAEGGIKGHKLNFVPDSGKGHYGSPKARAKQLQRDEEKVYGETEGQIGTQKAETYWQAMAQVYASCFAAIKPGGFIAVVVKDYVKNKQRVPLCDDTARLLEHIGFTITERVHASLVRESSHGDLFCGQTTTRRERKSFFRRLAEKKGSPKIDFEEVIFAHKP